MNPPASLFFRPPTRPSQVPAYKKYSLRTNPFKIDKNLIEDSDTDDALSYQRRILGHEIQRVVNILKDEIFKPMPRSFWLVEDRSVSKSFNNVVGGAVFAGFVGKDKPRVLPVYVPVPQATSDFVGTSFRLTVDRLLPRYLRASVYSFICRELETAVREGKSQEIMPGVDIQKFLQDIDATEGQALTDILFPKKEISQVEEYGVMEEEDEDAIVEELKELEKKEAEDAKAETTENIVDAEILDEEEPGEESSLKDHLIYYIYQRMEDPTLEFSENLRATIQVCMQEGFVKGRIFLDRTGDAKTDIASLLRLVRYYYNGVVFFVDQLDPWRFFNNEDKLAFMSQVYEMKLLTGKDSVTMFMSDEEIYKNFDNRFVKEQVKLPLNLQFASEDFEVVGKDEKKFKALMIQFLSESSKKTGLAPFSEDAVPVILKLADHNAKKALDLCGTLLDLGKDEGYPAIDKKFVEKVGK